MVDILRRMREPLPWPAPGLSIHTVTRNGRLSACLSWARGKRYGYEEGYHRAAQLVFDRIMTGTGLDSLVFPLAYLWRHAIELQLKRIIVEGAVLRDVDPPTKYKHHRLVDLWMRAPRDRGHADRRIVAARIGASWPGRSAW